MKHKIILVIAFAFFQLSCSHSGQELPQITDQDIQAAEQIEQTLQSEIERGELLEALESEGDLKQKGFITSKLIKRLIRLILPNHLENFEEHHTGLNNNSDKFAEYLGVYGRCYQFRVFYPYQDSRVQGVKWGSSILSIPSKEGKNLSAGVVLAPTLDGFSPFIESGLWLKLCRKGIANMMPESFYKRKSPETWAKLHFDPTPRQKNFDEYTLYEDSIVRYEKLLNHNLAILRDFENIPTQQQSLLKDLNVMKIKPEKVGFWGSSFGAVVGSLVIAKDPKIKAAVLSVGGGDLPYIIAHSKIALFKNTRKQQMKHLGMKSLEEYEDFISNYIFSDPLDYAQKSDGEKLYMILARKDRSVPTASQIKLHQQFGSPPRSRIYGTHVFSLLFTSWFNHSSSREAVNSLVEKFED